MGADLYLMKDIKNNYFRDTYNDSNLLWKFNLDYWNNFNELLDEDYKLKPSMSDRLLKELKRREPIFNSNLKGLPEEDKKYFKAKYKELKQFLNKSITKNIDIDCSV